MRAQHRLSPDLTLNRPPVSCRTIVSGIRQIANSQPGLCAMAKPNTVLIRLISSAGTGFYYVTKKNPRTQTEKLQFRKYDPVARKHVTFKEAKIK